MTRKRKYEEWQYEVQTYRRPDGALRRQRKLMYDRCPICGTGRKRISAKRCRRCYESTSTRARDAAHLLKRIVDAIDFNEPITRRTLWSARVLCQILGGRADKEVSTDMTEEQIKDLEARRNERE